MRGFVFALIGLVAGYLVGALAGYGLIGMLSSNIHDKPLEMAMTAAFVTGPLGAVVGLVVGWFSGRRRKPDLTL